MGVIVVKNHGLLVPAKAVETLLSVKSNTFGVSVVTKDEKGFLNLTAIQDGNPADAKTLGEIQQEYKDAPVIFMTDTLNKGYLQEDLQPFQLISNKDDEPELVVFMAGEYNDFAKKDSTHTGAFFAAHEYLRPKMLKLYDLHGADISKVMLDMDDPSFKMEMERLGTTDTSVVFMASSGKIKAFSRNENKRSFDWGWMSNHLGYVEVAKKEEVKTKVEEPKKLSLLDKLKGKKAPDEPKAEEPAPKVEEPVKEPEKVAEPKKADVPNPDDQFENIPVPQSFTNKQLRGWFHSTLGMVPPNYKKLKTVAVKKKSSVKSFAELKSTTANPPVKQEDKPTTVTPVKEDPKRETKDTPVPVHNEPLPMIPAADLKKVELVLKSPKVVKLLDSVSEEIVPLSMFAALEKDTPTFNEQVALDGGLERTFNWDWELLTQLPATALARLVLEYRYAYGKMLQEEDTKTTPKVETTPKVSQNVGGIKLSTRKNRAA